MTSPLFLLLLFSLFIPRTPVSANNHSHIGNGESTIVKADDSVNPVINPGDKKEVDSLLKLLEGQLSELEKDPFLRYASLGFCLRSPNGNVIAAREANRALIPASTIKLLTTAAVMAEPGPEYRFTTTLKYSGEIADNGVLWGDVIIIGGADPSLGSNRFDSTASAQILGQWLQSIQEAGIKTIRGKVRFESKFASYQVPDGWTWQDLGNYYAAPTSGLCFEENSFDIVLSSGPKPGDSCRIEQVSRPFDDMLWICEVTAGSYGSGDQAYVYLAPGQSHEGQAVIRGTIPPGKNKFRIAGAVPQPVEYLLFRFNSELKKAGIETEQRTIKTKPGSLSEGTTLCNTYSPRLGELQKTVNRKSLNLYAEQFLLLLADVNDRPATVGNGRRQLADFLILNDADSTAFYIADGSGLARENVISTGCMSQLLAAFTNEPWWNEWFAGLPVSGNSGTMKRTGKSVELNGKIHAKTGSMRAVRAYAGYVQGISGNWYSFSFIINNYQSPFDVRTAFEKLMEIAVQMP